MTSALDRSAADLQPSHVHDADRDELREPLVETRRIMRATTTWVAAGILAPAIALGPLVGAGWRPAQLPFPADIAFWVGTLAAAAALALLVWAACPVPAFPLEQAHPQKVFSVRIGIVMYIAGFAVAALAVLLSPAGT